LRELSGYRGKVLHSLENAGARIGDVIQISKAKERFVGLLIPRSEFADDEHVVLKMDNGYNLGVSVDKETRIRKIRSGTKPTFSAPSLPKQKPRLPKVAIISTGGTIASRVDYRTGGVRPALSANDLYSIVPELSNIAEIKAQILFSKLSENIACRDWFLMAKCIASHVEDGAHGVVVAHGTDTMGYTAAALSFALQDLPVPVVLVGSQRSADRPSSDAALNLTGAVKAAAHAPFAEVVVAMHETVSDDSIVFHRGVRVRKCHTSRRDAFKSVNSEPMAKLEDGKIRMIIENYLQRDSNRNLSIKPNFNEKVALVKFHPGADRRLISWYVKNSFKGIVLEGTGLGHVSRDYFTALKRAVDEGILVGMTSQCLWGRVNMNVYDTGRELTGIGVLPLEDMLPETALVKMMWVLGQTENLGEARSLLRENIVNELSDRTALQ
jgi:glutamyl-tRNA(Gln) amidotransferase subunit D